MANVANIFKIVNIALDIQRREIAKKSAKGTHNTCMKDLWQFDDMSQNTNNNITCLA